MTRYSTYLTDLDRQVFSGTTSHGARQGLPSRPVLLVVDVSYGFTGEYPLPILESIKNWHNSCGLAAWDAVHAIRKLLDVAHSRAIPVFYTTGVEPRPDGFGQGRWLDKIPRNHELDSRSNEIVAEIAPTDNDIVIRKSKPSAFHGTELLNYLVDCKADGLIVCGGSTSGCVRASVVDAFSYNFRVTVVEDGCFDRSEASHGMSLFDMDSRYADVEPLENVLESVSQLQRGLFTDTMPSLLAAGHNDPA